MTEPETMQIILTAVNKISDRQVHDKEEVLSEIRTLKTLLEVFGYRVKTLEVQMEGRTHEIDNIKTVIQKVEWSMGAGKIGLSILATILVPTVGIVVYFLKHIGYSF